MIELDLPAHWPQEKKDKFIRAFGEKVLKEIVNPLEKSKKNKKEKRK